MPVNFQEILSRPVESAERPKARPQGTYRCRVGKYETGESANKKTPYVRHFLHPVAAMEDVDMERLEANGGLRTERPLRGDFYLTDDALYRYREFLGKLGLTVEGRSFSECILEAENCEVLVYIIEEPGELPANADPDEEPPMYNRIDSYARVA